MRDDFQFDSGNYGYEDSEDEWDDEDANWTGGDTEEEPATEVKDESTAYLDFLNEEVCMPNGHSENYSCVARFERALTCVVKTRHKSSRQRNWRSQKMSWARIVFCWSRLSTRSTPTLLSGIRSRVRVRPLPEN